MTASSFADTGAVVVRRPRVGYHEFARYFVCSALALAVDAGLFALLLGLRVPYPVAAALGFVAGLIVAYTLSVRFVFRVRSLRDARAEFTLFAAIGVFGLLLTEGLLWLLIGQWQLAPLAAKGVTAGVVFGSNFTLRKLLLFSSRPPERRLV